MVLPCPLPCPHPLFNLPPSPLCIHCPRPPLATLSLPHYPLFVTGTLSPVPHYSRASGCLQAALQTLQGQKTSPGTEQAWSEPAAFVLEAMSHIPAVIRRPLAKQVFLQPFYKVSLSARLIASVNLCHAHRRGTFVATKHKRSIYQLTNAFNFIIFPFYVQSNLGTSKHAVVVTYCSLHYLAAERRGLH